MRTQQLASFLIFGSLATIATAYPVGEFDQSGCDPLPNSLGSEATLHVSGDAVLPGGHLVLEAYPVPNEPGLFFYSTESAAANERGPFHAGLSCLGNGGRRLGLLPVTHGVNNRFQFEVDVDELALMDGGIHAGSELRIQGWYRDQASPQAPFNFTTNTQVLLGAPQFNVLQILIDDIGFEFLRIYEDQNAYNGDNPLNTQEDPTGANLYPWTPFIDELASKGVRFNQFRANPTCSTTRATLVTGRYAFRHGVGALIAENRVGSLGEFGVGPGNDEFTIAQVTDSAGYENGYVGKWHMALGSGQIGLGGASGLDFPHILSHGHWDYAWSIHANLTNWPFVAPIHVPGVSGSMMPEDDVPQGYYNFQSWANFGTDPFETPNLNIDYATDLTRMRTKEMIDWAETGAPGAPWYVMTSFSAAHAPYGDFPDTSWLTTSEYWPAQTIYGLTIPGGSGPTTAWTGYCAHIEALDSRLEAMFNDMGGLDNVLLDTVVMVMGDNGSPPPALMSAMTDHGKDIGNVYPSLITGTNNHFKHQPYERGVRVPLIVAGPVVANPGTISNVPIDAVDVHATVADICQANIGTVVNDGRPQDGISFLSALDGSKSELEYIKTVRDWSFVERFSPNGDPRNITPPISNFSSRRRGFVQRVGDNWYKLIRKLQDDNTEGDEFYHLYNTQVPSVAGEVDPNELINLVSHPDYVRVYGLVKGKLEALLLTEP